MKKINRLIKLEILIDAEINEDVNTDEFISKSIMKNKLHLDHYSTEGYWFKFKSQKILEII